MVIVSTVNNTLLFISDLRCSLRIRIETGRKIQSPDKLSTLRAGPERKDNEAIKKYLDGVNFCIKVNIKIWLLCILRNKADLEARVQCCLSPTAAQRGRNEDIIWKLITFNFMSKSICERVAYWKTLTLNKGFR